MLVKTYPQDLKLFKKIGFEPFEVKLNISTLIGKYNYGNGSYIKVYVTAYSKTSQFYNVEIYIKELNKIVHLTTKTGSLVDFWDIFDNIALNKVC